ncbi:hypothetical protein [Helicobacter sp. MIT 05-5294]|uniref:hypothetical protein n=1 Tax=Helicobacter sp. MIT 05-5294 TaxID=1548150 RepID=UPI0010FCFE3D|nr:hypothetical protein [Helicobacter sp. MIT 05-5294]TLD84377.1 hypothetical protein LS69_009905 [Helicobacter sp. MIT 05-5294]
MKRLKLIYGIGHQVFSKPQGIGYDRDEIVEEDLLGCFLAINPQATKTDILELFEYMLMCMICDKESHESDEIFWFPLAHRICYQTMRFELNKPMPSFESAYFEILGELFLADYVDFIAEESQITHLSKQKEDKYQAWIYFRDNFLYQGAFYRDDEEDIFIVDGKEYTKENCPKIVKENDKKVTYMGYSTMYSPTSWDTPKYWSQYNIWVARTPKGTKYYNEILAPRFYNKYKDLEVEIDNKGNIIRWIGEINR